MPGAPGKDDMLSSLATWRRRPAAFRRWSWLRRPRADALFRRFLGGLSAPHIWHMPCAHGAAWTGM
jgi:hypothetical protein